MKPQHQQIIAASPNRFHESNPNSFCYRIVELPLLVICLSFQKTRVQSLDHQHEAHLQLYQLQT